MFIELSRKFESDLKTIVTYIANDSKTRAVDFAKDLKASLHNIIPNLYKYRKSIYFNDESIRDCIFKGYVIPYKIYSDKIVVLGIVKYRKEF